jgi:hypothetical protein
MTTPRTRRIPGIRWWHKWIGIVIGLVLLLWVVSGLVMILPVTATGRGGDRGAPPDWATATVSPAQALQAAVTANGGGTLRRIELKRIRGAAAYQVRLDKGPVVLVDATTAAPIRITAELAAAIAAEGVDGATPSNVELVGNKWHLDLGGGRRAEVHAETGDVTRSARLDRFREALGHDLHVFAPLRSLPGEQATRLGSLWITGLISLVSILTGYWLALPKRWRGPA